MTTSIPTTPLRGFTEPHVHDFLHGGACIYVGCSVRCPHLDVVRGVCLTCGCLPPLPGERDQYEIPLGGWSPCLLGRPEIIDVEVPDAPTRA